MATLAEHEGAINSLFTECCVAHSVANVCTQQQDKTHHSTSAYCSVPQQQISSLCACCPQNWCESHNFCLLWAGYVLDETREVQPAGKYSVKLFDPQEKVWKVARQASFGRDRIAADADGLYPRVGVVLECTEESYMICCFLSKPRFAPLDLKQWQNDPKSWNNANLSTSGI